MDFADAEYSFVVGPKPEKQNFSAKALRQCSRQHGWVQWQQRTRSVVALLEKARREATIGSRNPLGPAGAEFPLHNLAALQEPFGMAAYFASMGIEAGALTDMVGELEEAERENGTFVEGELDFLTQ